MKFIWKIENFSHLKGGKLQSPSFPSHSTTWELIIQQNSVNGDIFIAIELHCYGPHGYIPNYCSFALLDFEGLPFVWHEKNISCYGPQYTMREVIIPLIKRNNIFGSKKTEFLPNDILTVQCHIWSSENELRRPVTRFARSRVESAKVVKSFELNISEENFFRVGYILEHAEPIINGESLIIKLLANGKGFDFESTVSMFRCKMEFQIMLLDAIKTKKVQIWKNQHNFTTKEEKFTFKTEISKNMIIAHQNQFLSNSTITLHITCSFSEYVTLNRMLEENEFLNIARQIVTSNQISETSVSADKFEEINQTTEPHPSNTITQALQKLLKEGLLSDFNFKVNDRLFPVHKNILSARSQVFRAMFTTEMKEKEDNFVNIPDVDEDILERLLQFVYSDEFNEEMDWEKASCLYIAADKYALESLKQRCSTVLKSSFCVPNVLEVLMLSDMHQDQNLKSSVLDFISLNHRDIVGNERWSKFEVENGTLALDIFHSLYLKKD